MTAVRPRNPAPPGLFEALDVALADEGRMSPEHIAGVAEWLVGIVATHAAPVVFFSDEILLISTALNDASSAPISRIPEGR